MPLPRLSRSVVFGLCLATACPTAACHAPTAPTAGGPLTALCQPGLTVPATSAAGATVHFPMAASGGRPPLQTACTPPSGQQFAIGTTPVQCVTRDSAGGTATCDFPVTVTPPSLLARPNIMAFGDSITAGEVTVPLTAVGAYRQVVVAGASHPAVLERLLRARYVAQEPTVVNEGKPGEAAGDAEPRLLRALEVDRPDAVLLLMGYNDLQSSTRRLRAVATIERMAKDVRGYGARLFLATLTPGLPGRLRSIDEAALLAYNAEIRTLARGEGAVLVDLYEALLRGAGAWIGVDGLHPTEAATARASDRCTTRNTPGAPPATSGPCGCNNPRSTTEETGGSRSCRWQNARTSACRSRSHATVSRSRVAASAASVAASVDFPEPELPRMTTRMLRPQPPLGCCPYMTLLTRSSGTFISVSLMDAPRPQSNRSISPPASMRREALLRPVAQEADLREGCARLSPSRRPQLVPVRLINDAKSAARRQHWTLATHSLDLPRLQAIKLLEYGRHQRAKVIDIVAGRHHDHDADTEASKVLLVRNALINGQQCVELDFGRSKQGAVLDARPTGLLHCTHVVTRQLAPKSLRYALIEQQAHARRWSSGARVRR